MFGTQDLLLFVVSALLGALFIYLGARLALAEK